MRKLKQFFIDSYDMQVAQYIGDEEKNFLLLVLFAK